jgi:hypothetical protein
VIWVSGEEHTFAVSDDENLYPYGTCWEKTTPTTWYCSLLPTWEVWTGTNNRSFYTNTACEHICHVNLWWWGKRQSLKHQTSTPHSYGWSPEKTSLYTVTVKA